MNARRTFKTKTFKTSFNGKYFQTSQISDI